MKISITSITVTALVLTAAPIAVYLFRRYRKCKKVYEDDFGGWI
ncbi:hypothetical protein [Mucilaginibacter dorajii]|nr:hypothetical protein [Mucilaginibacter dorajii]MCS3736237.1 hypothetical protein [Mucilaginibacter dorajii]